MIKSTTIEDFRNHKKKQTKFACLTAYDASLSELMSKAGVDLILVGDSLGMVVQGHDSTIPVSMEDLLYHLRCVKRGNKGSHIMADMPFMSYATENLAYDNAMRLMQAGANSVKVEGGEWILKTTELLSQRGIPVCAHLGLTPQSINRLGAARTTAAARGAHRHTYWPARGSRSPHVGHVQGPRLAGLEGPAAS